MVLTGALITLFWDIEFLKPFKLLVVLVHEIWHGLSAMITGGTLQEIRLGSGEQGETLIREMGSHIPFILTASAGYLGTTLTGAVFLNRGLTGAGERVILGLFTVILWYISYIFTQWGSTAFFVGMGSGLIFTLVLLAGRTVSRYAMVAVGTMFVWYSFADTFDFANHIEKSDAGILAAYLNYHFAEWIPFSGPILALFVSISWTVLMVWMTYLALRKQFRFFLPDLSSKREPEKQFAKQNSV